MANREPLPSPNPKRRWSDVITEKDRRFLRSLRISSDADAESGDVKPPIGKGKA